jgi:hypothetical protein
LNHATIAWFSHYNKKALLSQCFFLYFHQSMLHPQDLLLPHLAEEEQHRCRQGAAGENAQAQHQNQDPCNCSFHSKLLLF